MADWRVLYGDLGAGTLQGELPVTGAAYGNTLNGSGSWSASLPLDANPPRLTLPGLSGAPSTDLAEVDLLTSATLATARTAVYFERDGVLLFAGIVWTAKANIGANTLNIAGEGLHSYFARRRHIRATVAFTGVDQADIARSLITVAQTPANGSIGVALDSTDTGVLRDRTYLHYERKPVGEAIEDLAAVQNGFDFSYRPVWVGAVPTVTFTVSYPATGRVTNHVFEVGTNCSMFSYDEDGTGIVDVVDAFGVGDGDSSLVVTAQNAAMQGPYKLLEDVITHQDVREMATLTLHAQHRLSRGAGPIRHVEIETFPNTLPALGSYEIGDQVTVRADHGWVQLADRFRIVEIGVSLNGGAETVRIALAGLESFEAV